MPADGKSFLAFRQGIDQISPIDKGDNDIE
jgi:hypothetical protein